MIITETPPDKFYEVLNAARFEYATMSWNGFNLFGSAASIVEAKKMKNAYDNQQALIRNLRHWREECGKLQAKLTALSAQNVPD